MTAKRIPWRDLPQEAAAVAREEFLARPLTHIPKDVMELFDRNRELKSQLQLATWKIWTLGIIVSGQCVVLGWAVKFILAHVR